VLAETVGAAHPVNLEVNLTPGGRADSQRESPGQ
jgi:hypothetical protein